MLSFLVNQVLKMIMFEITTLPTSMLENNEIIYKCCIVFKLSQVHINNEKIMIVILFPILFRKSMDRTFRYSENPVKPMDFPNP